MKPLTSEMLDVLERMRSTQSVAMVHVMSQWWAAENDFPIGYAIGEQAARISETASRRDRDRLMYDKPVFWTGTIAALVARGQLKFKNRKRERAEFT